LAQACLDRGRLCAIVAQMSRPPPNLLFAPGATDATTASLAGRELPGDMVQQVSNLTMGQLFYILSHIQKLSAQAPVTAQALLAENPQICYALLHAECLAGMIEEPNLPMSAEELRDAKARARRMQEELAAHELPPPAPTQASGQAAAMAPGFSKFGGRGPSMKAPASQPPPPPGMPPAFAKGPPARVPPPAAALAGLTGPVALGGAASSSASFAPGVEVGGPEEQQKQHLIQKLVQLTPEQIGKLPEHTKVQLLQFLQQQPQLPPGVAGLMGP